MGREFLFHPYALAFIAGLVATSVLAKGGWPLSRWRLVGGYLGVLAMSILIAGAIAYLPQETALSRWEIPAERYWPELGRHVLSSVVLIGYSALAGVALVGVPVTGLLVRLGRGSTPYVLSAAIAISTLVVVILEQIGIQHGSFVSRLQVASCHCGAVVLELELPDGIVDPRRCDCSMCRRRGAIVASVPLAGLKILQGRRRTQVVPIQHPHRQALLLRLLRHLHAPPTPLQSR